MLPVPTYVQYIKCPKCGSQVASLSNYCNICGKDLHQPILLKICPKCQTRIPASAKFCPECGKRQQELNNSQKKYINAKAANQN